MDAQETTLQDRRESVGIVLHGDLDEIPVAGLEPQGFAGIDPEPHADHMRAGVENASAR